MQWIQRNKWRKPENSHYALRAPWLHRGAFTLEGNIARVGGIEIAGEGVRVGYIKAGGYGHTLGGAVGLGPVQNEGGVTPDVINSGSYEIEVSGTRYPARASLRPMYDPKGERIRS